MKSTEIEPERGVSTSSLLKGRPNASWPWRVSASPWKENIRTFFKPVVERWKTTAAPLTRLVLTSKLSTLYTYPYDVCCSLYIMQLPRRRTAHTQTYIGSVAASVLRCHVEQGLCPQGPGLSLNPDATVGFCVIRSTSAIISTKPGQFRPVSVFLTEICNKDSKLHPSLRRPFIALFISLPLSLTFIKL